MKEIRKITPGEGEEEGREEKGGKCCEETKSNGWNNILEIYRALRDIFVAG